MRTLYIGGMWGVTLKVGDKTFNLSELAIFARHQLITLTKPDRLIMSHPATGKPDAHCVIWDGFGNYHMAHDTREVEG